MSFKERQEFESIEKEIAKKEGRKIEIVKLMNEGKTDFGVLSELGQELENINSFLEMKELRWLELSEIEN